MAKRKVYWDSSSSLRAKLNRISEAGRQAHLHWSELSLSELKELRDEVEAAYAEITQAARDEFTELAAELEDIALRFIRAAIWRREKYATDLAVIARVRRERRQ